MKLEKNWLEWTVFAMGCVLVLGVLGFLSYETLTRTDAPPSIEVKLGQSLRLSGGRGFVVPVELKNRGDCTASGVRVEVSLSRRGLEPESGEFEVAYLPRHSSRHGFVAFENDPRHGQLKARVSGYEEP